MCPPPPRLNKVKVIFPYLVEAGRGEKEPGERELVYGGGKERTEEAGFPDRWEWGEIRKNVNIT